MQDDPRTIERSEISQPVPPNAGLKEMFPVPVIPFWTSQYVAVADPEIWGPRRC